MDGIRSEPGQQAPPDQTHFPHLWRMVQECTLLSGNVAKSRTKKGLLPGCRNAEKSRTKKQTSRIADNPRKSELKKSSPAARLRKMRESAHKKRACCLFRDFRGPKRRCVPRSGRHPVRSGGLDVEMLQKVAQKRMPVERGVPKGPPRQQVPQSVQECAVKKDPWFQIGTASGQIGCYIVTKCYTKKGSRGQNWTG